MLVTTAFLGVLLAVAPDNCYRLDPHSCNDIDPEVWNICCDSEYGGLGQCCDGVELWGASYFSRVLPNGVGTGWTSVQPEWHDWYYKLPICDPIDGCVLGAEEHSPCPPGFRKTEFAVPCP